MGVGTRRPGNGCRVAMLVRFPRQRCYHCSCYFVPTSGAVFPCPARTTRSTTRDAVYLAHYRSHSYHFQDWSPWDMQGDPVTGSEVNHYLVYAMQEQLRAGVTPKQATRFLRPDFQQLMRNMHMGRLCATQTIDRLAYARDMAFFVVVFRCGSLSWQ